MLNIKYPLYEYETYEVLAYHNDQYGLPIAVWLKHGEHQFQASLFKIMDLPLYKDIAQNREKYVGGKALARKISKNVFEVLSMWPIEGYQEEGERISKQDALDHFKGVGTNG